MTTFLIYLLESGICLLTFFILFKLIFSRDTFFGINRIYLLATGTISFLIPTFNYSADISSEPVYSIPLETIVVSVSNIEKTAQNDFSYWELFGIIYLTGLTIFAIRFAVQLLQIYLLVRKNGISKIDGNKIVFAEGKFSPFSFFNIVFLNSSFELNTKTSQILLHEKVHIDKNHTFDIILFEIITIIQWFNPIVWYYKSALKDVHEFQADEGVISSGYDSINYQKLILEQIQGAGLFKMAHNFNYLSIKRRIKMLAKSRTRKVAILKLLFVIPLSLMLFVSFAISENNKSDLMITNTQPENYIEDMATNNKEEKKADKMPEFPGGQGKMIEFLSQNIKYPELARRAGIEGTVFVSFAVEANGKISHVKVEKSVRADCDEEAVRVVSAMPNWINETGQKAEMKIPVKFKLQNEKKELKAVQKSSKKSKQVEEFVSIDEMPAMNREEFIKNFKYPEDARKEGIQGKVMLRVLVDENGKSSKIEVVSTDNKILNQAAIDAIQKTTFVPGKDKGKNVSAWVTLPVQFKLGDGPKKD